MTDTDNVELKFVEVTSKSENPYRMRHFLNYAAIISFCVITFIQLILLGDFGFARFSTEKVMEFKKEALDMTALPTYNANWLALNNSKTTAKDIREDIFGLETGQTEASAQNLADAIDYSSLVCSYVMKLHFFTASVLSLTLFILILFFGVSAYFARFYPFVRKLTQTLLIVIEHLVFAFVIVALYLLVENANSKNYYADIFEPFVPEGGELIEPKANCLEINWGNFPKMHGNYYPHDMSYLVLFIFQFGFACIVTLFTLLKWVTTFLISDSENKEPEVPVSGGGYAPAMMLVHAVP